MIDAHFFNGNLRATLYTLKAEIFLGDVVKFGKLNFEIKAIAIALIVLLAVLHVPQALSQEAPLAYIVRVNEENWVNAHQLVNLLLRAGIPVYWVAEEFTYEGAVVSEGDFIIPIATLPLKAAPISIEVNELVTFLAGELNIELVRVTEEVDVMVYALKPLRIAIYAGHAALPTPYVELFSTLGFLMEYVDDNDIRAGVLENYDLLVVPGDGSTGILSTLGADGGEKVEEFVRNGGGYVSSCAGSWAATIGALGWDVSYNLQIINAKLWNVIEGEGKFKKLYPGIGVAVFRNINPEHPVMWGIPETFEMVWWQGPIFEVVSGVLPHASRADGLVVNWNFTKYFTAAEYYTNLELQKEKGLIGTTVYNATIQGKPVVVSGTYGLGKVVLFGPHPEFKTDLVLNGFTYVPGRMPINAALWTTSSGPYTLTIGGGATFHAALASIGELKIKAQSLIETSTLISEAKMGLNKALTIKGRILEKLGELKSLYESNPNPPWIKAARSWFGMTPNEMFEYYLEEIPKLCTEFESACQTVDRVVSELIESHSRLLELEEQIEAYKFKYDIKDLQQLIEEAKSRLALSLYFISEGISMKPGPTVTYGGKEGVLYLMEKAFSSIDVAIENYWKEKTTWFTEPLRNIGTYGAAGCIVHALNSLRGRTSYAKTELAYVKYVINRVEDEINLLKELEAMESEKYDILKSIKAAADEILTLIGDLKDKIRTAIGEIMGVGAGVSGIYSIVIGMGIITAIIAAIIIYVLLKYVMRIKA